MTTEGIRRSQEFLQTCEQAFIKDLVVLTSIDCGTDNKTGVDQIGTWVGQRANEWEMDVNLLPQAECGDFLTATLRGQGKGKILLLAHMDTVYPSGTAASRPTRIEGNKIIGPGTSDMKSCLLAGLYAMRALQVEGFSDFEEITLFCSSDEETGSIYSSPVYEKEAKKADVVLVLESARENGDIVSSRKGIGNFIFEIQGQAAHAGVNPKRGVNAITEMGYLIINLDRKMQEMQQDYPGITINPGAINGGTKANVVPDLTRLEIDVRVTNTHEQKLAQDLLDKLTDNRVNPKTSIKRTGRFTRFPWTKTPATAFLVEQAIHVAEEIGIQLEDTATGGASDANIIAKLGIPVLDGLGPIGGNSHSSDEYVLKASIIPRTIMLTSLLKRIIKYREQILEANRTS